MGEYLVYCVFVMQPYGSMGVFSLLCFFAFLFARLRIPQRRKKIVKFCMHVRLLSGQVFSHFGELWLSWSHSGGFTSGMSYIEVALGQSELGGGGGVA